MASYAKDDHVFKYRATFNTTKQVEYDNGMTGTEPVVAFSRWAAIHKASAQYIQSLEGFDRRTDIVIAIKAIFKDIITFDFDFDAYTVTLRDKDYVIRMVDADEGADIRGFHLLYLRRKDYQTDGR